ncbi:hypothetical protein LguiB_025015 [Lonicera macranthoides]
MQGSMISLFPIGVFLPLLLIVVRFLHKVWWTPINVQYALRSQGIKGPSYKFLHGSTKEMTNMLKESTSSPLDLSRHDVFSRVQPHIYSWIKLYGKNFFSWHGPQALLVITEPELIKELLNNKEGAFVKPKVGVYLKKLVGDGLAVTRGGPKWSKLRKIANHAFYADSLKGMVPAMTASVESMLGRWEHHDSKEIDAYEELRFLTSEVISRTAFGSNYMEGKNLFDKLSELTLIFSRNFFTVRFPGSGSLFKSSDDIESDKLEQAIHNSTLEIINKRLNKEMTGEAEHLGSDFLASLIKANNDPDDNARISLQEMIDESKTLYLAGQESTNGLLAWATLLLSIHTDWQEKARTEVLESFGMDTPNSDGIARLKIMSMIINETLRLYSPVANILRSSEREIKVGKYVIPANVEVVIPPLALHHNSDIWGKDAHLFKPERFAEGVAKATNNNAIAFIPFGYGPRTCVGLNFVSNEAKIALSMILQRYKFTVSPDYVHAPYLFLTLRPQHGIPIRIHKL